MKNTYLIAVVIVAIVIIVAATAGYAYISSSTKTSTTTIPTTVTSTFTSAITTTSVITSTITPTSNTTSPTGAPVSVTGAGGTLIYPLMSAWEFTYNQLNPNVQVNYASVGSGAGIQQITAQTVDFGGSDAPLTAAQYAALPSGKVLLTIPESASAVVPAYNLPGISNGLNFTGNVLAQIFLGNITNWNDPAIAALNPGKTLPNHAIVVIHRSDGSGTMYAFTNYLSDSSTQWATKVGKGTSVNWPVGLGEKGNEGVAATIINTQYSMGPIEIAYEINNKGLISYGAVQNAAGNFILANLTNIGEAINAGATSLPAGNAHWTNVSIIDNIFNDKAATYAYPVSTLTYLLVYQQQTNLAIGTAVVNFIWWIVNSAQSAGSSLGYIPLPANIVLIDDATLNSITYNGVAIH
ncbi:MAG: phosphate ABC transporter substrate-binding protein PstS [Nitrososphaeria archaeon]